MPATTLPQFNSRAAVLRMLTALFALLLIGCTWRLWTPQDLFPQIPLAAFARPFPGWVDWVACLLLVAGLACHLLFVFRPVSRRAPQCATGTALAGFVVLVLLDQHRLQPWAYHFVLVLLILAAIENERALNVVRWLTVSIYLHSALSKLDESFLATHGQSLVWGLLRNVSLSIETWPEAARRWAAFSLPAGELLLALLLLVPAARRWGWGLSCVMHVLLIAAVGPWGLNHQPAVILWNVYFLIQNTMLFFPRRQGSGIGSLPRESAASDGMRDGVAMNRSARGLASLAVEGIAWAAIVLPLLEPWGWFDTWPSWGLYASRPARVEVFVHRDARERMSGPVVAFVATAADGSPWCLVRVDRWSLAALKVPVYPQDRFALGTALALAESFRLESEIRVALFSAAGRFSGERTSREVIGRPAIEREAAEHVLNCFPRASR